MEKEEKKFPYWIDHPTEVKAKTKDGNDIPLRILIKSQEHLDSLSLKKKQFKKSEGEIKFNIQKQSIVEAKKGWE